MIYEEGQVRPVISYKSSIRAHLRAYILDRALSRIVERLLCTFQLADSLFVFMHEETRPIQRVNSCQSHGSQSKSGGSSVTAACAMH